MTSSAGFSGLILFGSPPSSVIASRMVARSTTAGTPVKSCMMTRAGVNWISTLGWAFASQPTRARTSSAVTLAPSSVRSRFSSRIFRLYGQPGDLAGRADPVDLVGGAADLEGSLGAEAVNGAGHTDHPLVLSGCCSYSFHRQVARSQALSVGTAFTHGRMSLDVKIHDVERR